MTEYRRGCLVKDDSFRVRAKTKAKNFFGVWKLFFISFAGSLIFFAFAFAFAWCEGALIVPQSFVCEINITCSNLDFHCDRDFFFTARQQSCGKEMFSVVCMSICLQGGSSGPVQICSLGGPSYNKRTLKWYFHNGLAFFILKQRTRRTSSVTCGTWTQVCPPLYLPTWEPPDCPHPTKTS